MRLSFIGQHPTNSSNEWRSKTIDYRSAKFRTSFENGYNTIYPTNLLKSAKKRLQRSQAKMILRPTMHPKKNPDQKKPKRGTPNKRNKRQASRPPVAASSYKLLICLAYGLIHKLANCYYAFPKLAPSYFKPRNELAAQIKEKLANNTNLQEQLRKLKKARRSSSSKSIKMSDTPVPNTIVE
jgi:hypothetical protein